jgi:hypothetical protein
LDSVILLVHPPAPLPGNIFGMLTDKTTQNPIAPGIGKVVAVNGPAADQANTMAPFTGPDGGQANYSFQQPPGQGFFVLAGGTWQLTAQAQGYDDSPVQYFIVNGGQQRADFQLQPIPLPAKINFNLSSPFWNNSSTVTLYQNGQPAGNILPNPPVFNGSGGLSNGTFTVNFSSGDNNNRCFTIATSYAYHSNLAGQFSNNNNPFPYQAQGWSSSTSGNPANAWNGNMDGSSDTICVHSQSVVNIPIPLVPVPTTLAAATVHDTSGNPINAGGPITYNSPSGPVNTTTGPLYFEAYWQDGWYFNGFGNEPSLYLFSTTYDNNTNGLYKVTVPDMTQLFPEPGNDAYITAHYNAPLYACCNQTLTNWVGSQWAAVPPDVLAATLIINDAANSQICGNAGVEVQDAQTNSYLDTANVTLGGTGPFNVGGNEYNFECSGTPPPPYRINTGPEILKVLKDGYYPFDNQDYPAYYINPSYAPTIPANQIIDLGTVSLWPMGTNTISGKVVVQENNGTTIPAVGVNVVLTLSSNPGSPQTYTTGQDGTFTFSNVQETWPPANCPSSLCNIASGANTYSLTVPASTNYTAGAYTQNPFTLAGNTPANATVPAMTGIVIVVTPYGAA